MLVDGAFNHPTEEVVRLRNVWKKAENSTTQYLPGADNVLITSNQVTKTKNLQKKEEIVPLE